MSESRTLRLVFPQWQGAESATVAARFPELPSTVARRAYAVGANVLAATLPHHQGPTAWVPVSDDASEVREGVESLSELVETTANALDILKNHDWDRLLVLGGECSVSVAPFTSLVERYGDDIAIIWIDTHPDTGTVASDYAGFHAMALSAILGHGESPLIGMLPAAIDPSRVAIAGLHDWRQPDFENLQEWGVAWFSPDDLRQSLSSLMEWLEATGCHKVAIHFDVDTMDDGELTRGPGEQPIGLRASDVQNIVDAVAAEADVVGFTIAEFMPPSVVRLVHMLGGMPLIDPNR